MHLKFSLKASESCPLAEEDEIAARTSEFQLLQREQKKSLHEYHVTKEREVDFICETTF